MSRILDTYYATDQPTTCPECGARTDPMKNKVEQCLDPQCRYMFRLLDPVGEIKLPVRYKPWGVGKFISSMVYVHRSAVPRLQSLHGIVKTYVWDNQPEKWDILRVCIYTQKASFILCPDFDTVGCPEVGNSTAISFYGKNPTIRLASTTNPFIYHHKWLMVRDDYAEFDVEEAKEFSRHWMAVAYNRNVSGKRYGRKKVWVEEVEPFL